VIKFVSDLRQFGGFLRVIRFFLNDHTKKQKTKQKKQTKTKRPSKKKQKTKTKNQILTKCMSKAFFYEPLVSMPI
jgi:Sec-independent protein translocase protein TatA